MAKQSELATRRRQRHGELFRKRMCLHDCGRPAAKGGNICAQCDRELCARYFERLAKLETRPAAHGTTPRTAHGQGASKR